MAKKQKRACLIYNPTSGQEIMERSTAEVLDILGGFGYEISVFQTTPEPNSTRDEVKCAAEAGFDLVIAVGGDGTINEVANGIIPLSKYLQMAIIPMGMINDFARALKIPRSNPVETAKIIGKNQTIQMGIGQARGDTYFINIAAAGSFIELTHSVPSQLKAMFGYSVYLVEGVELLPGVRTVPVRVKYKKDTFEGDVSIAFTAITSSVSGFEQIAPDAKPDDGKFTLILVKTASLIEILRLIHLVLDGGKRIGDKRIEYIETNFLEIEPLSDKKIMINSDGEYGDSAPVKLRNLKNHITFFANTDEISDDVLVWNQEDLTLEAVAQKFTQEIDELNSEE